MVTLLSLKTGGRILRQRAAGICKDPPGCHKSKLQAGGLELLQAARLYSAIHRLLKPDSFLLLLCC